MLIEIATLRERRTPYRVDIVLTPDRLELDSGPARQVAGEVKIVKPIVGFCELTLVSEDHVRVRGEIRTELESLCSRCLTEFRTPIAKSFDLMYAPDPVVTDGEEISLKYEDLEVGFYRNDVLDLRHVVVEPIFIDLPMKSVCSPDCKGLCDQCGTNLNVSSCTCRKPRDNRFDALGELRRRLDKGS